MAKLAEPWKWEARGGWYAWVRGSRRRLASLDEGKRVASRRLHAMLDAAEAGGGGAAPPAGELVLRYLQDLGRRRDEGDVDRQTKPDAGRRLAGFVEMHGALPADQVKPHHVQAWLDTRTRWGPTSRHDGVGAVKAVFRWALRQGLIDRDPLAGVRKPQRKARREEVPNPGAVAAAFDAVLTPELADLLVFLHDTGCRPKEARTLEAAQIDLANGVAVLSKHKTAKKTGRKRVLYLQGRAREVAERLARANPTGALFRNSAGNPWTKDALVSAVARVRRRVKAEAEKRGEPAPDLKSFVPYALRHLYITEGAARGVPAPLLAELAGHADLRMISTYSHLSDRHGALGEAAARIVGPPRPSTPAPPDPPSP